MTRNGWYEEPTSVRNTIAADIWRRVSERIRHQSNENREGLTPVLRRERGWAAGLREISMPRDEDIRIAHTDIQNVINVLHNNMCDMDTLWLNDLLEPFNLSDTEKKILPFNEDILRELCDMK